MILVTGANGFVGRRLVSVLTEYGYPVRCAVRADEMADSVAVGDIGPDTDWSAALDNMECVVHTAARAHIMKDPAFDPLTEFRKVNTAGTLTLARQAAEAHVHRFVFISSIGVNGNQNTKPFTEYDTPAPHDLYAISKFEAEEGLWEIQQDTGMEVVIIRPPLVYGLNAPGNFGSLVRLVEKGIPLPLGAIHNKRSLVALDNLVDLIVTCIDHPSAANQVFLAGDAEDVSTTELLRGVAKAMGKPARLIPVSAGILEFGATLLGKKAVAQRLLGSLQVDISKAREVLGWQPPISVYEGLRRAIRG